MNRAFGVGDVVAFIVNGMYNVSRVFGLGDGFVYVDYFDGSNKIYYREKPLPINMVELVSRVKKPEFTLYQIQEALNKSQLR
jgi:hypothetical protein